MKKELFAAALLAVVFAGVMVNIRVTQSMTAELINDAATALESARRGEFGLAEKQIDKAVDHWLSLDGYTHIFIRHSEINSTTEAFFQLKSDIYAHDTGAAEGSAALLHETLRSLSTMEQISIGSIF